MQHFGKQAQRGITTVHAPYMHRTCTVHASLMHAQNTEFIRG